MGVTRRLWWLPALLLAFCPALPAAQNEDADYNAAARAFEDELWARAEKELGRFIQSYPDSNRRPLAVLLRAQALLQLGRAGEAVELLETEQPRAGSMADAFVFWLGEAEQRRGRPEAAAARFRELLERFPDSALRLEASVNEAAALAAQGRWERVAELLGDENGVFQKLVRERPDSDAAVRGHLLRAEALWRIGRGEAALVILRDASRVQLSAPLAFRRLWLEIQILQSLNRVSEALPLTTNLVGLARSMGAPIWEGRARLAHAAVLEAAGDAEGALALYRLNLATNVPPDVQSESAVRLGRLALVAGRAAEATRAMETFLQVQTNSPITDLVMVLLGELELEQCLRAAEEGQGSVPTNLLARARGRFESVLGRFPDSPYRARVELDRGWCLWLAGDWAGAAAAFEKAAAGLPEGPARAAAHFKLGDVNFRQGRYQEAIRHYREVTALAEKDSQVRTQLCEPALYQIVRSAVEVGDLAAADQAVGRILSEFPGSYLTEAALTLQGQGLARHGNPRAAREIFTRVLEKFPDTPKKADLQLAVARTYELEGNWQAAVEVHRRWLEQFPRHELRPQVEFALGWALARLGEDAAALQVFTNFVARYTNQPLAARAQWWVADHYYTLGPAAFVEAERQYQLLATVWTNHPLAYEARMMAGRVAMARQAWSDAIGYFTNLTSDLQCPEPLKVQALFAYGDAVRRLPPADTNAPLANFEEAARIFAKVLDFNPTNAAAARAWGEIGECYLQLATRDPALYATASNAFQQALSLPASDVPTRCQAWVGLGLVNERLAAVASDSERGSLLRAALDRYVDVLYGRPLRPGESPDPFWTRRAGLEAARVAELLGEWRQALRIYERLRDLLPPLQPGLEKRMERVRERLAAGGSSTG